MINTLKSNNILNNNDIKFINEIQKNINIKNDTYIKIMYFICNIMIYHL